MIENNKNKKIGELLTPFKNYTKKVNQIEISPLLESQFTNLEKNYKEEIILFLEKHRKILKEKNEDYLSNRYDMNLLSKKWVLNNEIISKILNKIYLKNSKKRFFSILKKNWENEKFLKRNEKIAEKFFLQNLKNKYFFKLFKIFLEKKKEVNSQIQFDRFKIEVEKTKNVHEEFIKKLKIILEEKNRELDHKSFKLLNLKRKFEDFTNPRNNY